MTTHCFACGTASAPWECEGCGAARYCNEQCQREAWIQHGHASTCAIFAERTALGLWREATHLGVVERMNELPPEILAAIYGHLPSADVKSLMAVNKQFRKELAPIVWNAMIRRDVPAYLFDKSDGGVDRNSAMRPVYDSRNRRTGYEDRVHPQLRMILDEYEATDLNTAGEDVMFSYYERIMRSVARGLATEFVTAIDFVRSEQLPTSDNLTTFGGQRYIPPKLLPPGLDRLGYIGMVYCKGGPVTLPENIRALRQSYLADDLYPQKFSSETLWRVFGNGNSKELLVDYKKEIEAPMRERLRNAVSNKTWTEFKESVSDALKDKETRWKAAYAWILHMLIKVEASATLTLWNRDARNYAPDYYHNGVWWYYFVFSPEKNSIRPGWQGDRQDDGQLIQCIFRGLLTGNTRFSS